MLLTKTVTLPNSDCKYTFREAVGIDELRLTILQQTLRNGLGDDFVSDASLTYGIWYFCKAVAQSHALPNQSLEQNTPYTWEVDGNERTFIIPSISAESDELVNAFNLFMYDPNLEQLARRFMNALDNLVLKMGDTDLEPPTENNEKNVETP